MLLDIVTSNMVESATITIKNGVISFFTTPQAFSESLPSSISQALRTNYDTIKFHELKHLLKCASIVGPRFSLEEIALIWDEPTNDLALASRELIKPPRDSLMNKLETLLRLYDTQGFVESIIDPFQGNDGQWPYSRLFSFRANSSREIILSTEDDTLLPKRARHAKLIALYESLLTDDSEALLIPMLCHQYAAAKIPDRTSIHKRLQYLEMVGTYMVVRTQSYIEARQVYEEVREVVRSNALEEDFGHYVLADWEARLAQAYGHGIPREIDTETALKHALAGLELLKVKLPQTNQEWNHFAVRETLLMLVNNLYYMTMILPQKKLRTWLNSRKVATIGDDQLNEDVAGSRKKNNKKSKQYQVVSPAAERLEKLVPILELVSDHLFRTHANLRDQICFDLFSLNTALKLGRNVNQARGKVMANLALKLWFTKNRQKLSRRLSKDAERRIFKVHHDFVDPSVVVTFSQFLIASGDWERAHQFADKGMFLSERKGKPSWSLCK
jgi:hypothetical protein